MRRAFGAATAALVIVALWAVTPATSPSARARKLRVIDAPQAPPAGVATPAGRGQPPPRDNAAAQTGTAVIRGRVLAVDGAPLRRAQVTLSGPPLGEARIVATDEQGQYEITNLPPGSFTFRAAKRGYLTLSYGQRRPGESPRPFEIANGQSLTGIDFHLPRGGVIAVRVTDETGNPLSDVEVLAQQYRFSQGVRALARVATGANPFVGTNDRGELRLYGLAPGEYYISAAFRLAATTAVPGDRRLSYAPTFYPGTPNEVEAERVSVAIGEEKNIDIRLTAVRLARVSGVIRSSSGGPLRRISIGLDRRSLTSASARGTRVQPDGGFTFTNVAPGDYFVNVFQGVTPEAAASPDASEYAMFPVTVTGDDVTGLVVTAMKPGSAYGRVVFDEAPDVRPGALPILANIPMRMASAAGTASNGRWTWNDDWTFEVTNLLETRVFRLAAQSQGWFLKAVRLDGNEVTDVPLDFTHAREVRGIEIVLTRKQTEVSGSVVNASGQPVVEYAVVVYAENPALRGSQTRFIAAGQPNQQGRFTIRGLPPGRYLAAAVEYLETGSETDRDLLARLESYATPVTLGEGESRMLTLRVVQ